jgi:hypothetical protein
MWQEITYMVICRKGVLCATPSDPTSSLVLDLYLLLCSAIHCETWRTENGRRNCFQSFRSGKKGARQASSAAADGRDKAGNDCSHSQARARHSKLSGIAIEEALGFAQAILEYGAGASVRRVTLFNHLGKSPESSLSRQIITNANKYGLIKGGYQADILELTQEGKKAADEQIQLRERTRSRIQLAILDIEPFRGCNYPPPCGRAK